MNNAKHYWTLPAVALLAVPAALAFTTPVVASPQDNAAGTDGHLVINEFRMRLREFLDAPKPTLLHVLCTPDEAPVPATLPSLPRTASMMYAWARQGRRGWQSAWSTIKAVIGR